MSRLDDGYPTTIVLENLPSVPLYEKEVTPPGLSGGGAIDTTTMRNSEWRTASPKALKSLAPVSVTVAFDPAAIDQIMQQINVNQKITVNFPDGSKIEFYGWIDEFTPGAFTEGEQPTATLTIQPSLVDPTTGEETAPTYTAPQSS